MFWFDKVAKRFWVCKLGLSAAFDYICSAPSRKIVKWYLLTLLLFLGFRTGYSQATETADSLNLPVVVVFAEISFRTKAAGEGFRK